MNLSPDQQNALNEVMAFLVDPAENEMALSGPAGTGKTFLTKVILDQARKQTPLLQLLLNAKHELNTVLTSSTNKAAKVLSDAASEPADTIHKLLGLRVVNNYKTGTTSLARTKDSSVIQNFFIVVDEASMINRDLLETIRKLTMNCKVLYIGDQYQLAPVFENEAPVFSMIKKQVHLTTIQRQATGSPIIAFSQSFKTALDGGSFPKIASYGNKIQLLDEQSFQNAIDNEFQTMSHDNSARALAWTNIRVHQLNSYIRHTRGTQTDYVIGEHLVTNQPILLGNRPIFNTDAITQITHIAHSSLEHIQGWVIQLNNRVTVFQAYNQSEVTAYIRQLSRDKNWTKYFEVKERFGDLRPIYACTCNKAQGSTYDTVFIDLNDIGKCTKDSDITRMLYTSITRAKNKIVMTGSLPKRLYV